MSYIEKSDISKVLKNLILYVLLYFMHHKNSKNDANPMIQHFLREKLLKMIKYLQIEKK